jgi:phenylpyruvate tautomerase PptA (4-oxalocrotonate tautomerase family)
MSNNSPHPPNHAIYEVVWRNSVDLGGRRITKKKMHIACWVTKATNTHLGYVIITAFPQKKWLHGGTSVLLL